MKILYVQPGLGIGGSKVSLRQILRCAPSTQISFVALSFPVNLEYEEKITEYVSKIHYLQLPTWQEYRRISKKEKIKGPFSNTTRLISLIPSIINLSRIIQTEKIDLVHTNNSMTPAGAIAAFITHRPHVWHIREPIGANGQYPLILGDRISFSIISRFSDVIVCNSAYTAEPFQRIHIPVVVVQNGVDINEFANAKHRGRLLRESLSIDENDYLIGMVGNITTAWKGHSVFLEVAAQLVERKKNLRFVIFGGSSNLDQTHYTRDLKMRVEALGLTDRLLWAEFISDNAAIMNCIDILIHPVAREGSGRVVMEAMAAGKPVIGFQSGGVQELIQNGITGFLVQPYDKKRMVEISAYLLESRTEAKAIGENARCYASAHFSEQASMNELLGLYSGLVY